MNKFLLILGTAVLLAPTCYRSFGPIVPLLPVSSLSPKKALFFYSPALFPSSSLPFISHIWLYLDSPEAVSPSDIAVDLPVDLHCAVKRRPQGYCVALRGNPNPVSPGMKAAFSEKPVWTPGSSRLFQRFAQVH